jgi:phosphate transport system protein
MTDHTVKTFDADLANLLRMVAAMGDLVETEWNETIEALVRHDDPTQHGAGSGPSSGAMQREIEDKAVVVIARRQPVARDLRLVVAVWETAIELNRVGDLARNIVDRERVIGPKYSMPAPARGLRRLSRVALRRLREAVNCVVSGDDAKAAELWGSDNEIDALYSSLCRELLTYMMSDPESSPAAVHLLFCAKSIESIGDHVTNIADAVHYLVQGRRIGGAVENSAA